MFVSCDCCVLCRYWPPSDALIARLEESYTVCACLIVCEIETLTLRRPRPGLGCFATELNLKLYACIYST